MAKPRLCEACSHPVGQHDHIAPHMCKVEKCNCWGFAQPISHSVDTPRRVQ